MAPLRFRKWIIVVVAASLGAASAAQVVSPVQSGPPRDGPPPQPAQPTVRRIPVGTATISGTVSAADTGRPLRGARVSVFGSIVPAGGVQPPAPGAVSTSVVGPISLVSIAPGGGVVTSGSAPVLGRGLGGGASVSRTVVTDASGQFSFPRLPAGQFTLQISQSQYLAVSYGQKRFGGPGTTIRLTDGQQFNVRIQMMRGGVITGTVYAEDGDPQRGLQVRGLRYMMINGVRRVQQSGFATTDDRGNYRLYGLQPGDYIVSATPNQSDQQMMDRMNPEMAAIEQAIASGAVDPPAAPGLPPTVSVPITPPAERPTGPPTPPPAYLPVYAPSSLIPSGATMVSVNGGDERPGVDIQVHLAQASQVEGTVSAALEPGVNLQVSLLNDDPTLDGVSNNSARADQNGKFTFRAIAPGKYTVFAQTVPAPPQMTFVNGQPVQPTQPAQPPRLTDAQKMWGRASITVEGQLVVNVNMALRPGRTISGMVVFEMARPPDLTRVRPSVFLSTAPSSRIPMFSSLPPVQMEPDGRFTLTGVMPGRYTLRPGIGILKSVLIDGQDTADFPLDFTGERDVLDAVITVTDKVSELTGVLTDATGKPAPDYTIMVAAADSRYWIPGSRRIVTTRPATDGRYIFRSLPPGDYVLAVVTDLEQGAQYDPEFLKSLSSGAIRVTVMEGGTVTQDLRVK